jgi:hypothetical protein
MVSSILRALHSIAQGLSPKMPEVYTGWLPDKRDKHKGLLSQGILENALVYATAPLCLTHFYIELAATRCPCR